MFPLPSRLADFAAAEPEKMTWRTPLKYWRQFVALAACLVLLSCAIPLISYILPSIGRIFTGNAGAGSDEVTYPEHYYDMSDRDLIEHIGAEILSGKHHTDTEVGVLYSVSGSKLCNIGISLGLSNSGFCGHFL